MSDSVVSRESAMELIHLRRSIRNYTDTPVSEEDLRTILEAGQQAPSGENHQPWRFTVVRDKENKDFLSRLGKGASGRRFTADLLSRHIMERFAKLKDPEKRAKAFKKLTSGDVSAFVNQADVIIIISGWLDVWDAPYDVSAAIENMSLAAASWIRCLKAKWKPWPTATRYPVKTPTSWWWPATGDKSSPLPTALCATSFRNLLPARI